MSDTKKQPVIRPGQHHTGLVGVSLAVGIGLRWLCDRGRITPAFG
jgi:hypothetical protein